MATIEKKPLPHVPGDAVVAARDAIVSYRWKIDPRTGSRLLGVVVLLVALIASASTVSSQQAQQSAQGLNERSTVARKRVDVIEMTGKSAAGCTVRLRGFIEELEGLLSWAHSVYPIQHLFEKYFPLEGCDLGAALELCLKSKYCRDASAEPGTMVLAFDSQWNEPHWGLHVTFGLDRRSGDSKLPFVKVKI